MALRYNLAVHLAPMFNVSLTPEVAALAAKTKADLVKYSFKGHPLRAPDELMVRRHGYYDIDGGPGAPYN